MTLPLSQYVKVKDRYCIHYVGPNDEYIDQLIHIRPAIEEDLPGIKIYICCRVGLEYLKEKYERLIVESEFDKNEVAYVRYLDDQKAVWKLIVESYLPKTKASFLRVFPKEC